MFDVAIYTDVRAAEAVDGIDGFNFESLSKGITQADLQVIRRDLLHKVSLLWEGDPLEHPGSFGAVRREDRLYVARGRSTGRTSNGRSGNQITEVIVTDDLDDLGGMNPAQLFGAVNWRLEKVGSRTAEQWAPPLEVDPSFTPEGLIELVRSDRWATDTLPSILQMALDAADGSARLVFVSSSTVLAQRWIALVLLVLPPEMAANLEVRGLVDDAMTAPGQLIATSPAFGRAPDAAGTIVGTHVVDLDSRRASDVAVSPAAREIATWFTAADVDAVLEAVEATWRWTDLIGQEEALRVARATALDEVQESRGTWAASVRLLGELARAGRTEDLLFFGDALLDASAAHRVAGAEDAALAADSLASLVNAEQDESAAGLLVATLESFSAASPEALAWTRTVAAETGARRLKWADAELERAAASGLAGLAHGLDPQQSSDLLVTAQALGLELPPAAVADLSQTIARAWVASPGLGQDHGRWAYEADVVRELAGAVLSAWRSGEPHALKALGTGEYSWLSQSRAVPAELRDEMLAWVEAGRVAAVQGSARRQALERAGHLPPSSWRLVLGNGSLLERPELVTAWLASQHGLTGEAATTLRREAEALLAEHRPLSSLRPLMGGLVECGDGIHDLPLATLARRVVDLDAVVSGGMRAPERGSVIAALSEDADIIAFVDDRLGSCLARATEPKAVDRLAQRSPALVTRALAAGLDSCRDTPRHLAVAVTNALALRDSPVPEVVTVTTDFLTRAGDDRSTRECLEEARSLRLLTPETAQAYDEFTEGVSSGRTLRKLRRATARLAGPRSGRSQSDSLEK